MERNGESEMHSIPLATLTLGPEFSEGLLIASVCVYCACHVGCTEEPVQVGEPQAANYTSQAAILKHTTHIIEQRVYGEGMGKAKGMELTVGRLR